MKNTSIDLKKLHSDDPKVKYGFSKELLQIVSEAPKVLYPHVQEWTDLLQQDNQILKWTAIDIIGHLSSIDTENKIDPVISQLIEMLHGGHLITISHAISSLAIIAGNKPRYGNKIWSELFDIRSNQFKSDTCRDIATGKVLDALKVFPLDEIDPTELDNFVGVAEKCEWNATRQKANIIRRKLQKSN
ncbi:MAG: hypothetical protein OEM26_03300 [Saprospiraceae bacterium]|nr:hypothetical protein [Saprospiraceae bacterium]